MSARHLLAAALVVSALNGCATAPIVACRNGEQPMLSADLMFGRKSGGRIVVSEDAWRRFLESEIAPRFPDGLTVTDAAGQWRDAGSNSVVQEPSKVVTIVFRDAPDARDRLDAIADAYKRRFAQRSVGVVIKPACASF